MVTCENKADIAIILVHEIYGINQHITNLYEKLSQNGFDVFCPNLLGTERPFRYDQESDAYQYFNDCVGFKEASTQILKQIRQIRGRYRYVYIIGFSVGATTAWLCTEENLCDAAICFYGSRIRDYLHIEPKVPVLLLFSLNEKSFNVPNLVNLLKKKSLVSVKTYHAQHGFADPYSKKYCEQSAYEAYMDMRTFLNELSHPKG